MEKKNINKHESLTHNNAEFWTAAGGALSVDGRKVRTDAVLKNLSYEAQALVAEWSEKPKDRNADGEAIKGTGGIVYALGMLAEVAKKFAMPELLVSKTALLKFLDWWRFEQKLEAMAERMAQVGPMSAEEIAKRREVAEVVLLTLGISERNARIIATAARMQDSRRSVALRERKFEFERERAVKSTSEELLEKAVEIERNRPMRNAEKIAAMRKAFFADIEGRTVELPP